MEDHVSDENKRQDSEGDKEQRNPPKVENKDNLDRYTIGWVCALPKEQTAARAVLDEEFRHVHIRKAVGDTNTYTLGSIGRHNIAIACLPKGQLGVIRASKVATSMTSTFRNMKFVLMVGIGGGVPSGPNDVRLGDVVVSTPTGQYPGVVQWDFGKPKDGKFERTGSLNNPPTLLLTALSKVESDHEMEGSKIQENLDKVFKKLPRLKAKYGRSDQLEDYLFAPNYNHIDRRPDPIAAPASREAHDQSHRGAGCLYCDHTKARKRDVGEPVVHYGLIASGNQVIKDAAFRDEISNNLGGNVLCVEMEAAGLMDDFPCLVIRGICDYADSHKNKAWQEHAAAVAAAFTKELLEYVPPVEVDGERPAWEHLSEEVRRGFEDLQISTAITNENTKVLRGQADSSERDRILDWLTPVEYGAQQSHFLGRLQDGTGKWFLETDKFIAWRDSERQTLFCSGNPGVGKTILTSFVIDQISTQFKDDRKVGVAYIFFNFRSVQDQDLKDLFGSLTKQLGRLLLDLPDSLKKLHKDHSIRKTRPSATEFFEALRSVALRFSQVYLFVDALDEHNMGAHNRSSFLSHLLDLQRNLSSSINIFATSRKVPDVENMFSESPKIEVAAVNDDIHHFISSRLPNVLSGIDRDLDLDTQITKEIVTSADGIFLLAHLYLDSLEHKTCAADVRSALKILMEHQGKHPLYRAYDEAISRIDDQPHDYKVLGRNVISWISNAMRPLTVVELQEKFVKEELMVSVCAGLVTAHDSGTTRIIELVHKTTQDYIQQKQQELFPDAHRELTETCSTYLSLITSLNLDREGVAVRPHDPFRHFNREVRFPLDFFDYVLNNWWHHAKKCSTIPLKMIEWLEHKDARLVRFLLYSSEIRDEPAVGGGRQKRFYFELRNGPPIDGSSALHWAAFFDLHAAIRILHQKGHKMGALDSANRSPLWYALKEGNFETALAMVRLGADTDQATEELSSFLPLATGSVELLATLLNHDKRSDSAEQALKAAMVNEHLPAIKLLLERGGERGTSHIPS
ncbi:hypothetical protein CGLO_08339 [Colletotrichum gloeosporioides Cg-14]|uniref:Uncharacterized protein n=1 Tax=Colletotrichum gloeosporioides (strain Cg-14) TaxID=1237896 RepID=T0LK96_COLGC|nr:hypothetical protein CGLO_08339 [Colletotrichum gloeosporioides Cg-14]